MKKIHFEKEAAEAAIMARQAYIERINELGAALKTEGIVLNNEILSKYLTKGPDFLGNLLVGESVRQYNQAGIQVNSLQLASLQQNASSVASSFDEFRNKIQQAQLGAGIGPDLVNFTDEGKAVFTETERKEIVEKHTVYLKKADEPLYQKLGELADTLNQMDKELKEAGEISLIDCLKIISSKNSMYLDENQKLRIREDIFLILNNEESIEVNPVYFNR